MSQGGYMDDVRVKISEKYKPPPRINFAISYSQRLSLNKQIQDTIPQYDFVLEKTVVEKMQEWRSARERMFERLNKRVQLARDERETDLEQETDESVLSPQPLIPTQVTSSFSSILTPIPLKAAKFSESNEFKSTDKSPFNISDFEADNYSPFDNLELKSINDMEELAQVLKVEEPKAAFSGVSSANYAPNYSYAAPTSYVQQFYTNGYHYRPETIHSNQVYNPVGLYNQRDNKYSGTVQRTQSTPPISSYKSIPDIMKTLEKELDNTQLNNTEIVAKVKTRSEEKDEEFNALPKNVQDLSRTISLMGFPLPRVARVCKVVGLDQKKVVEHLLAMSELLDLGFSESRVSTALLQSGNDRDKALDILIS